MTKFLYYFVCWSILIANVFGQQEKDIQLSGETIDEKLLDEVLSQLQSSVLQFPSLKFSHEFRWRSKGGELYKDIKTTKIAGQKFRFESEKDENIIAFDGNTYQYYSKPRDLVRLGKIPDSFGVGPEWTTGPLLMLWAPIIGGDWKMDGLVALQNSEMWANFRGRIKKIERQGSGDKEVVVLQVDNNDMQYEVTLDPKFGYQPVKFIVNNSTVIGEVVADKMKNIPGPTGPVFIPLEVKSEILKEKRPLMDDAIKTVKISIIPESIEAGKPISDKEFIIPSTLASRVFDADRQMFIKRSDISQSGSP